MLNRTMADLNKDIPLEITEGRFCFEENPGHEYLGTQRKQKYHKGHILGCKQGRKGNER